MTLLDNDTACCAVCTAALGAPIKNKIYNKNPPFVWAANKRRVKGGIKKILFFMLCRPAESFAYFSAQEKRRNILRGTTRCYFLKF